MRFPPNAIGIITHYQTVVILTMCYALSEPKK
jgi:hypothetical protein